MFSQRLALGARALEGVKQAGQGCHYLLVLDLEGKDEITEFPVIIIDAWTTREVGRFHRSMPSEWLVMGLLQCCIVCLLCGE